MTSLLREAPRLFHGQLHDLSSEAPCPSKKVDRLWLLVATGLYLYLSLFASWKVPYLLGGDQTFFWMDGQRILSGEVIFRDFFRFVPPGTSLLYRCVLQDLRDKDMGRQYGRSWPGVSILRSLLLPLLPSNESRHGISSCSVL